ncbi:MAG: amidohydrolase family protein [Bacteroidota bacterium]
MTLAGARMLDLHAHIGSLEVGKDADLVILLPGFRHGAGLRLHLRRCPNP